MSFASSSALVYVRETLKSAERPKIAKRPPAKSVNKAMVKINIDAKSFAFFVRCRCNECSSVRNCPQRVRISAKNF